jgi:rubrerythrin
MPLTNFGAILNFAETVEREDMEFYRQASSIESVAPYRVLFEMFVGEGKKNISLVQRTRRENVTEMILEPIRDFVREGYLEAVGEAQSMDLTGILAAADMLENRAIRYYKDAAEKIHALPEVSRALKTLAKKRTKRIAQLQNLSA